MKTKPKSKSISEAKDEALDKKRGIKENSKADVAADKKMGVKKTAAKVPAKGVVAIIAKKMRVAPPKAKFS